MQDLYEEFIHKSRYARYLPDKKRRENWGETVDRYMDFMDQHLRENHNFDMGPLKVELRTAIFNKEIMPSMRCMMTAGPALARDNTAGYNCSYVVVDDVKSFDEAMHILLCGTGVGFSVERQYINQLPEVPEKLYDSDTVIVVKDSKEGWAKAFRQLIAILYSGEIPKWDTTRIRPAGSRLKIFGGRASGPGPLEDLFRFTVQIFRNAKGRKLTSLECHDIMCKIGDAVVVGGVRRSAMISLSNLSDDRMRNAKSGEWWTFNKHRSLSNNSAVYTEKPEAGVFMREWLSLYESKSGERGIFNRQAAKRKAAESGRRNTAFDFGTNPCSEIILRPNEFCVSGDTQLITNSGIFSIEDLKDKAANVWNGTEWSKVIIRQTRKNSELVRVTLSDGSYLDCTPDHRFSVKNRFEKTWREVRASDLISEKYVVSCEPTKIEHYGIETRPDAYTLGFAVGDGCATRKTKRVSIGLYGLKDQLCPVEGYRSKLRIPKNYNVSLVEVRTNLDAKEVYLLKNDYKALYNLLKYDRNTILQFIAGLADADGSQGASGGIRIYLSKEERARSFQLLLTSIGIKSTISLFQRKGHETNLGIRKEDLYYVTITECNDIPCNRLNTSNGHKARFKSKYQSIRSVERLPYKMDVYCFNEPKKHKAVFGNVLTYQCNLTEVVVRSNDTPKSLGTKVKLATILGTFQATLTHFPYLRKIWKNNTEEERLLGVSLTGILDNKLLNNYEDKKLPALLEQLRNEAIQTNKQMAESLGIPQSASITCVKPSGTVSQLVNSASGIHPRHSPYYFRTVRGDAKDPLVEFMKETGFKWEPDAMKPYEMVVFTFPRKSPDDALCRNDLGPIEHLKLWLIYQRHWCEHKPSITVSVKENEWPSVGAWVYENFNELSGVSFLPYDDHVYLQPPYDEVTKEQYEQLLARMPKNVDWDAIIEDDDNVEGAQMLACVSQSCEL